VWTLTDVDGDVYVEDFSVGPQDVEGQADGYRLRKRTLRGGLRDGVDLIDVDNGRCRFALLPTRGMGVWRAWVEKTRVGWDSPVRGPVHPRQVPLAEASGLGWLDGFDELLVRCGLESNGAPDFDETGTLKYPLHGRIGNRPAHKVDVTVDGDTGEISVTGTVDESRFHFQKLRLESTVTTRPGEKGWSIRDRVSNLSGEPAGMQLLYHVNFGPPLLEPGSRLVAPVKTLAPRNEVAAQGVATWDRYPPEQPGFVEQVHFMELLADAQGQTQTLLKNAEGTLGVTMRFNTQQLPCFTQWKDLAMRVDGYVTGLEPGTNFPNPRTYEAEQGRVVRLEPGQGTTFDLAIEVHTDATEVARAEQAVNELRDGRPPQIFSERQDGWSPR
jgi:hypothetical protein